MRADGSGPGGRLPARPQASPGSRPAGIPHAPQAPRTPHSSQPLSPQALRPQATKLRGASAPAPAPDRTSSTAAASRTAASSATGPPTVKGSRT